MSTTKTILKRTADMLEKLGIGSIIVGLFQNKGFALIIGACCVVGSYLFSFWEAKK